MEEELVNFPLTAEQKELQALARRIAQEHLRPRAAQIDRDATFPVDSIQELGKVGLWGLTIPREYGGRGADMLSTVLVIEALAQECASTAMCFKMHLEAVNPLAHLATPEQAERFLGPIARGELFMSVASNEPATGRPMQSLAKPVQGGFYIDKAEKAFVTSSHYSHLFQFLANHEPNAPSPTAFIVERDKMECSVQGEWDGLGMRGNDSCHVTFSGTIPNSNVVGSIGGMADVRKFHLPFVFLTYAAVYLGIAEGAFEEAKRHVTGRTFLPAGRSLAQVETVQRYFGEMMVSIDRTQALVYSAASLADRGAINDLIPFQTASVAGDETALEVTNTAMIVGGGTSFAKRNSLERYLRDARAGVVMVPQDDLVKLTLGRAVLGVS